MKQDDRIAGVVERITFMNRENGYTVAKLTVDKELATVVGIMPGIQPGLNIECLGQWHQDAKYGLQFQSSSYQEVLPTTREAIERYLGSGLVKGIGPSTAKRIVDFFGEKTLDVLDRTPEKLAQVKGLSRSRREALEEAWYEQREVKNIMLFLQGNGVSPALAAKIYKTYGQGALAAVRDNPYRLADEVQGIGFKTADTIAFKLGFAHDSPYRCRSALQYQLSQSCEQGHCYLPESELYERTAELIEVDPSQIAQTAALMMDRNMLVVHQLEGQERLIQLPAMAQCEAFVARRLGELLSYPDMPNTVAKAAQPEGITYDATQLEAIDKALQEYVLVITGGPGTGKTTTLLGILNALEASGQQVLLAAPTGRAAKRMSETTGRPARTIHRLLEYKPGMGFMRTIEENPLDCDALVVDEASMIDIYLMYHLLKNIPDGCRLLLVGDVDQLPAVGPGNVLSDILQSGVIPSVRLTHIFRQAQKSRIITNAHRINAGKMPDLTTNPESDFFFIPQENPELLAEQVVDLCARRLPSFYNTIPQQIQVLCPQYRGAAGVDALNQLLQQRLNPYGQKLLYGGVEMRLGDKVMQTINDQERDVYNGDIGIIEFVEPKQNDMSVNFYGRTVQYHDEQIEQLTLAYAVTIHKSQGSEFNVVVAPLCMQHYAMLERNLLYTCVTRAKQALILVGSTKAVAMAVKRISAKRRYTRLKELLERYMAVFENNEMEQGIWTMTPKQ